MTDRIQDRDRAELLIEAGMALASERSLEAVLRRIVEFAAQAGAVG